MRLVGERGGMTMRRLISILIITGAVLAVAQAAVAQLTVVPITVTSQTLQVITSLGSTGKVVGGSSVGTSWNLGDPSDSTVGTVSSVLTDGELIFTIDGTLSRSSGGFVWNVVVELLFSFDLAVPSLGESTTPVFFQMTWTSGELTGPDLTKPGSDNTLTVLIRATNKASYTSALTGGGVRNATSGSGEISAELPLVLTFGPLHFIPGDTVTLARQFKYTIRAPSGSTVTFSNTYTFRALTFVPEPSASLSIPSGVGMLLALAKLRGVSLTH